MKKSKLFKKSISTFLAGATLFQSGILCAETHAENEVSKYYKTATATLGTLAGAELIGVVGLALGINHQAKKNRRNEQELGEQIRNSTAELTKLQKQLKIARNNAGAKERLQAEFNDAKTHVEQLAQKVKDLQAERTAYNQFQDHLSQLQAVLKRPEDEDALNLDELLRRVQELKNKVDRLEQKNTQVEEAVQIGKEALKTSPEVLAMLSKSGA